MNLRFLTTTMLAAGLVLPAAAVAQESYETQQGTNAQQSQQNATQQAQPSGQSQQIEQAMTKLEEVQQKLDQAGQSTGGTEDAQLGQLKEDARGAVQEIETALQMKSQNAQQEPEQLRQANQAIEDAKQKLQQQDVQPQQLAQSLESVEQAVRKVQSAAGQQAGAEVTVQQPAADVTVEKQAPEVIVEQKKPEVTIQQNEPEVTVQQPQPEVTVKTQEPDVTVQESDQPKVKVQKDKEADVTVIQGEGDQSTAPGDTQQAQKSASESSGIAAQGNTLVGMEIYGANKEKVGEVQDVVVSEGGQVEAVLTDVGGFLGIGGKQVAIPADDLRMGNDRIVATSLTKQQAEKMPEYNEQNQQQN